MFYLLDFLGVLIDNFLDVSNHFNQRLFCIFDRQAIRILVVLSESNVFPCLFAVESRKRRLIEVDFFHSVSFVSSIIGDHSRASEFLYNLISIMAIESLK